MELQYNGEDNAPTRYLIPPFITPHTVQRISYILLSHWQMELYRTPV